MSDKKDIEFLGNSLVELRSFPCSVKREIGFQLDKVQAGLNPADWKPMNTIGFGVREIRVQDMAGTFRVVYVAKFAGVVYVLHCFQKKSQKTSKADIEVAIKHYTNIMQELKK